MHAYACKDARYSNLPYMVGTMHTDYAPRARPQTAPAACWLETLAHLHEQPEAIHSHPRPYSPRHTPQPRPHNPLARPQTTPAACFPPPHHLCLHAPRVLACGASCVRCELAPTGNTHLYSTVSKCMLDRTPEEPGPLVAAACSRRSCLPTHRMMRTWAARSLRVLQCAVASSSPPCNRMGNVGTAGSLPVEPRPQFSSGHSLHISSPTTRITRIDPSSRSCWSPAISVLHPRSSHSTPKPFSFSEVAVCGQGVPCCGCSYCCPQNGLRIEMCNIN
jgi:hypothetical protein